MGGSNLPGLTYTPPTPETSASLSYVNGETKVEIKSEEQVRKGFAQELSRGIDSAISLNEDTWETTVFDDPLWELIFEAITETVPDFIPVYGEYLELKRAVEAFDNGSYGQSSFHFSMAILGVIGIDKIKDIAKITGGIKRAFKVLKLLDKLSALNPLMDKGMLKVVSNSNKMNSHIFRISSGHMPDLQPIIDWAGGKENLVYLVYKKAYDSGFHNLVPNPGQIATDLTVSINNQTIKFSISHTNLTNAADNFIQIPDFWIP